ncbi:MAG TPA: GyrI-like domain-containing protein [Spirochaetota bacterium]|nr:GyrI-like domain-containing protein [Spirochaetota bacterium]
MKGNNCSYSHIVIVATVIAAITILTGCGGTRALTITPADCGNPRIFGPSERKMLVARTTGDPDIQLPTIIKLTMLRERLTDTKSSLVFRAVDPKAKKGYIADWAYPVPAGVDKIPDNQNSYPNFRIETWKYGEAAAILHKGPYDKAPQTITRLEKFIAEQGYEVSGVLEEEFVKGPGKEGPGIPDEYLTIIRYEIVKKPR